MCGIILLLRAVSSMLVRNVSPRGSICFKCLMFSLSGFVIFTLFYCLLNLRSGECDVVSLYFLCCSANESVCELFGETIRNMFGLIVILLLNVMEVLSVGGGALLDRPCMIYQRMCVLCLCSQCASRCFFHKFSMGLFMSEVISPLRSLRAGSQVFALNMRFLCVIFHTMWWVKSLQLLCILPFGILCLSAIMMMFVNNRLAVCILVGIVVGLRVSCSL